MAHILLNYLEIREFSMCKVPKTSVIEVPPLMHTAQRRAPQIASRAPNHFVVVCVLQKVVLKNRHTVSDLNFQINTNIEFFKIFLFVTLQ